MSGRKPSWQITALIETHNLSTPYAECEGCSICSMIEEISKEAGLWLGKRPHKRMNITAEELEELLNAGYMKKEICAMKGISKSTLSGLIKRLLPERSKNRNIYNITISLEEYRRMKNQGMKREEIAKQQNVPLTTLERHIWKLNKEAKQHEIK